MTFNNSGNVGIGTTDTFTNIRLSIGGNAPNKCNMGIKYNATTIGFLYLQMNDDIHRMF